MSSPLPPLRLNVTSLTFHLANACEPVARSVAPSSLRLGSGGRWLRGVRFEVPRTVGSQVRRGRSAGCTWGTPFKCLPAEGFEPCSQGTVKRKTSGESRFAAG